MEIKMNLNQTFNGFKLDATAIKLQSMDSSNIRLPYTGNLPVDADSAYIAFKMVPAQAKAVLVCKCAGKDKRFPLEYTATEIKQVLDAFFFARDGGTRFNNGLDRYWLGLWTAHYIDWKRTEAV